MLHEIGHLFYFNESKAELVSRKMTAGEVLANKTAIRMLKTFCGEPNRKILLEYAKYYNSMQKNGSRSKFILD